MDEYLKEQKEREKEIELAWGQLGVVIDETLPRKAAERVVALVRRIVKAERAFADKQAAVATDLMMRGEALRERVMLDAILGGAYDKLVPKPREG